MVGFQSFFVMNQIPRKLSQRSVLLNWDTTYFLFECIDGNLSTNFKLVDYDGFLSFFVLSLGVLKIYQEKGDLKYSA